MHENKGVNHIDLFTLKIHYNFFYFDLKNYIIFFIKKYKKGLFFPPNNITRQ